MLKIESEEIYELIKLPIELEFRATMNLTRYSQMLWTGEGILRNAKSPRCFADKIFLKVKPAFRKSWKDVLIALLDICSYPDKLMQKTALFSKLETYQTSRATHLSVKKEEKIKTQTTKFDEIVFESSENLDEDLKKKYRKFINELDDKYLYEDEIEIYQGSHIKI